MQVFPFLAAFLLVRHFQQRFKRTILFDKWKSIFQISLWSIILIYVGSESAFHDWTSNLIGAALLGCMIYYIKKEPDFKSFVPFANSHIPLITLSAVYGIILLFLADTDYFERWHNYVEFFIVGAFVWIFARLATSKKQQKELQFAAEQNTSLEKLVAERTIELTRQKDELQATVKELKATQAQLIQQEKLASLGELTAGIAHEIQNPLNFVNNFSEVSKELMEELEEELEKGDTEEVKAIAADVIDNLTKITHHGKRADGIVKGMLQHSRSSTGQKEPTDINALADEYFRLAYHGLRAKDKSFNAELITHFNPALPKVSVIPQDVGRVLLNLFTNAFYAVQQKQKTAAADYKPVVEVDTMQKDGQYVITVKDNGIGIPEHIKDKIMQPFFTTKPTGEGTGLGLSLSYDIIVKGHGGEIDIDSRENEYTRFTITLPL